MNLKDLEPLVWFPSGKKKNQRSGFKENWELLNKFSLSGQTFQKSFYYSQCQKKSWKILESFDSEVDTNVAIGFKSLAVPPLMFWEN